jgi:ribosome-associated protein YbcJ (S4-like RNA binding protein)
LIDDKSVRKDDSEETTKNKNLNDQMTLHFEELQNAILTVWSKSRQNY